MRGGAEEEKCTGGPIQDDLDNTVLIGKDVNLMV